MVHRPSCVCRLGKKIFLRLDVLVFERMTQVANTAFKEAYRHRAGIEGTHAQALRTMGLRRSRYIGLRKTHLGHIAVAAAFNLVRLTSFLRGEAPEQIRTSAFKRAMKQAV